MIPTIPFVYDPETGLWLPPPVLHDRARSRASWGPSPTTADWYRPASDDAPQWWQWTARRGYGIGTPIKIPAPMQGPKCPELSEADCDRLKIMLAVLAGRNSLFAPAASELHARLTGTQLALRAREHEELTAAEAEDHDE